MLAAIVCIQVLFGYRYDANALAGKNARGTFDNTLANARTVIAYGLSIVNSYILLAT